MIPTLTSSRRAENLRLREAATPGPWNDDAYFGNEGASPFGHFIEAPKWDGCRVIVVPAGSTPDNVRGNDAAYIVAACNDLPLYESALAEAEKQLADAHARYENLLTQLGD